MYDEKRSWRQSLVLSLEILFNMCTQTWPYMMSRKDLLDVHSLRMANYCRLAVLNTLSIAMPISAAKF